MGRVAVGALYAAVLAVTIVGVDLLFFRHHIGERLAANVGIALVFAAFYWRFFKR